MATSRRNDESNDDDDDDDDDDHHGSRRLDDPSDERERRHNDRTNDGVEWERRKDESNDDDDDDDGPRGRANLTRPHGSTTSSRTSLSGQQHHGAVGRSLTRQSHMASRTLHRSDALG